MKRLVIVVAVVVVALLAALMVVPSMIDWNGYRGEIERQASQLIGRQVRVGGNVAVQLLPTPYLSISDVRIADEANRFIRPFLKISTLSIRLAVPPLLKGEIEAEQVIIEQPELNLVLDAEGRGNWRDFGSKAGQSVGLPSAVALSLVRVERGAVTLSANNGSTLVALASVNGELAAPALNGPYRFKGSFADGAARRDLRIATGELNTLGGARLKITTSSDVAGSATFAFDGTALDVFGQPALSGDLTGKQVLPAAPASALAPASAQGTLVELSAKVTAEAGRARLTDIIATLSDAAGAEAADARTTNTTTTGANTEVAGKTSKDAIGTSPSGSVKAAPPGIAAVGNAPTLPAERAQELRGSAMLSWTEGTQWTAELTSNWLDLDRLMPATQRGTPRERLLAVIDPLLAAVPNADRFQLKAEIAEARLGGGLLEEARVGIERAGAELRLTQLSAGLPGQSRIEFSGQLATVNSDVSSQDSAVRQPRAEIALIGPLQVQGVNLQKLFDWLKPVVAVAASDGVKRGAEHPFLLQSELDWSATGVNANAIRAEIGGVVLTGHWRNRISAPASLDVLLDSDALDLRGLWTPPATLAAASELLPVLGLGLGVFVQPGVALPAVVTVSPAASEAATIGGTQVQVRLGQVLTDNGTLRDVSLQASQTAGALNIREFAATSDLGFAIKGDGLLSGSGAASGTALSFMLTATKPEGVAALSAFADVPFFPAAALAAANGTPALLPLKLAGSYTQSQDQPAGRNLVLDGMAASSRLILSARGDGLRAPASPLSLALYLQSDDAPALRAQVSALAGKSAPATQATGTALAEPGAPATAMLNLEGSLSGGLKVLATLSAGTEFGGYSGSATKPANGASWRYAGNLKANGADAGWWAALLGVDALIAQGSAPFDVSTEIAQSATGLRLMNGRFGYDGRAGNFALNQTLDAAGAMPGIALEVQMAELDAAVLAGLLVRTVPASQPPQTGQETGAVWSDQPFDFTRIAAKGSVRFTVGALRVTPQWSVRNASLNVSLTDAGVEVTAFDGAIAGGTVSARGTLNREPAGAALTFTAALKGSTLETATGGGASEARARGALDIDVTGTGRGLSPRSLAGLLTGSGTVRLGAGQIADLAPLAINNAARALLSEQAKLDEEILKRLLARGATPGGFVFPTLTLPITIADGGLSIAPVAIEAEAARLRIVTVVDLLTAIVDSEWQLAPKPAQAGKPALAAVRYQYFGPVAGIAELTPIIDVSDLQKDLMARRLIGGTEMQDGLWPSAADSGAGATVTDTSLPADSSAGDVAPAPKPSPAAKLPGARASTIITVEPGTPATGWSTDTAPSE